jgi:energy-coupling factor transport system substrate-specific component
MNVSAWVTTSGDHSLGWLLAYMGTSLPFDIAHATGNIVFCLAFGPALVRALRRYRTRFDIIWLPPPDESTRAI